MHQISQVVKNNDEIKHFHLKRALSQMSLYPGLFTN